MDKKELQKLLSQPYKQENWKNVMKFVFRNTQFNASPLEIILHTDDKKIIKSFKQLGTVRLDDGKNLALFEVILTDSVNLKVNRVKLNEIVSRYIDQQQAHGVLSVFEQGGDDFRFTFSAKSTDFDIDEGGFINKNTDKKRFTYVLGKNETCKTPADRFYKLSTKDSIEINDVQGAFSVEQLSKEFFDKYKKQFDKFWTYINSNKEYKNIIFGDDREKGIRDFTKKLLGRIVFLHFLQKKGWMACAAGTSKWEDGDKKFMQNLLEEFKDKEHFHSKCLAELFFNTLNRKRTEDLFVCIGLGDSLNNTKVPYLNGGLFDSGEIESRKIDFPIQYFEDLLEFFGQYNFTIDENDPNDHEVGIDPEMLGHIFENLLEDNKDKGAFYTPKVIVQYMCQESLVEYLSTKLNADVKSEIKDAVEDLVRNRLAEKCSDLDLVEPIAQALYDVKVCDPAIGSGAFPMGILNTIYQVIEELFWLQPDSVARVWNISDIDWQPHLVKKNIIQHSIYGVDIESGAVDIARLRFWLALVVDEIEPLPLPNLDYKIMQGNSLLESFEGIDLSQISDAAAYEDVYETEQMDLFTGEAKKSVSISLNFEDIESLMDEYFNANEPENKKEIHKKIDDQVLNHIRFTLLQHKQTLLAKKTPLERKLKLDIASAVNSKQIEKIKTASKTAKELAKINVELGLFNEKEIKLAQLSNSNERPFFLWHLFFKEVFDDGGFDIVIGNPPYFEISDPFWKDYFKNKFSEVLSGHYDIYIFFYKLAFDLIKTGGVLTYITPHSFLHYTQFENLRKYIYRNTSIIELTNRISNLFENAVVDTSISVLKKKFNENHVAYFSDKRNVKGNLVVDSDLKLKTVNFDGSTFDINALNNLIKLKQFEVDCIELGSLVESTQGITVYAKVQGEKINYFRNDSTEINSKKYLRGRDINRYENNWDSLYIIYGSHLWCPRNPMFFEQPKIFLRQTASNLIATYVEEPFYCIDSVHSLISKNKDYDLKYVLAILNSKLGNYLYDLIISENGKVFAQVKLTFLRKLPIKKFNNQKLLIDLVDEIYISTDELLREKLKNKIDLIVYKLYNVKYENIKEIDENYNVTIEEYNSININK